MRAAQKLIADAVHVMHRLACVKHVLGASSVHNQSTICVQLWAGLETAECRVDTARQIYRKGDEACPQ